MPYNLNLMYMYIVCTTLILSKMCIPIKFEVGFFTIALKVVI